MGLSIAVGLLAEALEHDAARAKSLRANIEKLNLCLAQRKLPPHREPETRLPERPRCQVMGFPYSFLHYLRYAAARRSESSQWVATPLADGVNPAKAREVEEAGANFDFHLLVHSDAEGFYVPTPFRDVVMDRKRLGLPGGMAGSSNTLLAELVDVAPALAIRLDGEELSLDEIQRLEAITSVNGPLYRELFVWLALFEASRLSIRYGALVVFC